MEFEADDKVIGKVLFEKDSLFFIPRYQRPYTWGHDQLSEFWNDIQDAKESYFVGSMIISLENVNEKNKRKEIIDGQQRILTITLIAAVLRDFAKSLKDMSTAQSIQNDCISVQGFLGKNVEHRIICGESTQDYFKNNIQNFESKLFEEGSLPKKKEYKQIYNNYKYLQKEVEKILNGYETTEKKIVKIKDILHKLNLIKIVLISIKNEGDAYEIFETVNAKGSPLGPVDMIKNLVLSKLTQGKNGIDEAKITWDAVENHITNTNFGDLQRFMRTFWISKYSFSTNNALYKKVKGLFQSNVDEYYKFLNEMENSAKIYNNILNAYEESFPGNYSNAIIKSLKSFSLMNITQCQPLLISIFRNKDNISEKQIKNSLKDLENFSFIYSAISNEPTNTVYKLFSDYAIDLENTRDIPRKDREKKISKILENLKKDLKKKLPSKALFLEKFLELNYQNKTRKLISYILENIEYKTTKYDDIRLNFPEINIDHIFPQAPDEKNEKNEKILEKVHNIGNLTLLHKKLNGELQNKLPLKKIDEYKKSRLNMAKEVALIIEKNKKWEISEIENRAKILAEKAFDIWSF